MKTEFYIGTEAVSQYEVFCESDTNISYCIL